jgi:hypothetical protein
VGLKQGKGDAADAALEEALLNQRAVAIKLERQACMPRRLRFATGGYVYHVLNRAVGRATLFEKLGDRAAFESVVRQAKDWRPALGGRDADRFP